MPAEPWFHFDSQALHRLAEAHGASYRAAQPFPHAVFDDFLPEPVLHDVLAEFPHPDQPVWKSYRDSWQVKLEETHEERMGEASRRLFQEFNSSVFVEFLEALTGIEGIIPDPHLDGGGLHQIEPGGFLKVHSDYNWHDRLLLDRRLNVIVYLNDGWRDEYGGALELWDKTMSRCEERIAPVFNRCVIFNTTDWSFHGHPEPLSSPPGMTRKSLALYYFTNGRPASEVSHARTTAFQPRPGEVWRRQPVVSPLAKRLLPPIVADVVAAARAKRRSSGSSGN